MNTSDIFPRTVVDLEGHTVNVEELAKRYVLILVTLKATWCPVCPQLLVILNHHGLQDDTPTSYRDPFDKSVTTMPQESIPYNRLLLRQDAFFIVVCPGPIEKVRKIRNDCNFSHFPYHFVVDEDLSLSTSISLRMSRNHNEIWPCVARISPDTLSVHPIIFGRSPGYYGQKDLLNYLHNYRVQAENNAEFLVANATKIETLLKQSMLTDEDVQQQMDQPQQGNEEQFLPVELLTQVFDYLEPMDIVKTVIPTSRLWRAIGLEVIVLNIRREIKNVSELLVTCPRTNINEKPYYSRIMSLKQKNKLVGVYELNQHMKALNKIVGISQRLLVYCNTDNLTTSDNL